MKSAAFDRCLSIYRNRITEIIQGVVMGKTLNLSSDIDVSDFGFSL